VRNNAAVAAGFLIPAWWAGHVFARWPNRVSMRAVKPASYHHFVSGLGTVTCLRVPGPRARRESRESFAAVGFACNKCRNEVNNDDIRRQEGHRFLARAESIRARQAHLQASLDGLEHEAEKLQRALPFFPTSQRAILLGFPDDTD
jgi:hypothetical protein